MILPALPASEHELYESLPLPVVITAGPAHAIVFMNRAFRTMTGAPADGVIGSSVAEWLAPEDLEKAGRNMAVALAGDVPGDDPRYRIWSFDRTRLIDVEIHSVAAEMDGQPVLLSTFVDASRRARAERELRRAEADLLEAQDVGRIGSYVYDIREDRWTSSGVLDDIFGIDATYEHSTAGWGALLHPDDAESMVAYFADSLVEGAPPFDRAYRVIRPSDGQTRWVHGRGRLRLDEAGRPSALIGTVQDITEQRRSDDELRESERRFAALFEQAPLGYQSLDAEGCFIDVNQAWLETLGYSRDEVIGRWFGDFLAPEYVDAFRQRFPMFKELGAIQSEFEMVHKDGARKSIAFEGRIGHNADGSFRQTHCILTDVTERRRAERELNEIKERLQAILDYAPMLVYVLDPDGRFTLVNRALNDLIAPGLDMVGMVREDFLPREIAETHRANDLQVIETALPLTFEERNLEADGEHVYLSTKFPVFDHQGSPAGVCGISLDITDRTRAEQELAAYRESLEMLVRERTAELEEASKAKSAFLASMSHELRTPLNSIIGFTGVMLQGLSGELNTEQRAQLTMVNRAGRQLLGLVSDVLDLSRIEAGRVELELEDIDVPRVVQSLAETVDPMAKDVGLTLQVDVGDAPPAMRTDLRKMEQILLNLLSNAIKYTDEGGIALTVTDLGHGTVSFAVRDTGIGIAHEDQERVFDEFRQLPASREAKHPGSGLGLAISRQLAELLGGSIELESALGKGSTFTLILPLDPPPAPKE